MGGGGEAVLLELRLLDNIPLLHEALIVAPVLVVDSAAGMGEIPGLREQGGGCIGCCSGCCW